MIDAVLASESKWAVVEADCLRFLRALPPDSCDLVMGSPPYESQRTYGIGFDLKGQAWVDWMVEVFRAAAVTCKGLVCMVVEGFTKDYRWSATPALLLADHGTGPASVCGSHPRIAAWGFPARAARIGCVTITNSWSASPVPASCPGPTTRRWATSRNGHREGK